MHLALPIVALFLALAPFSACSDHSSAFPSGGVTPKVVAFETRTELSVGSDRAADAVLCDLNGDSNLDLVVTTLAGKLHVLLGAGNGTFAEAQVIDAPGFPFNVACANVVGDPSPDLIVVRTQDSRVDVHRNNGQGNFDLATGFAVSPDGDGLAVTDANCDDNPDLVLSHLKTAALSVWLGDGKGGFQQAASLALPPGANPPEPIGLESGDINGDQLDDLAVTDLANDRVVIYQRRCSTLADYADPVSVAVGDAPIAVSIGDVSGDTLADLTVSNRFGRSLTVLRQRAGGYDREDVDLEGEPSTNTIADVTGDAIPDVAVCVFGRASVTILPGQKAGGFGAALEVPASGLPYRAVVGDVNGDAAPDMLVTGSGSNRVNVYFGGPGGLRTGYNYDSGIEAPKFVAVVDFDGDGRDEFAVGGRPSKQIAILGVPASQRAAGIRAITNLQTIDIGEEVLSVVKGDFNGDGRVDLGVTTIRGLKLVMNRPVADGYQLEVVPPTPDEMLVPGPGFFDVTVADMNGDGLDDIVASDAYAEQVIVLRATSRDLSYEKLTIQVKVSDRPAGLIVADLDGDGDPDVAVSRNASSTVALLRNDGTGALAQWQTIPVGAGPNYLRAADFNQDGTVDLVTSNAGSDQLTVLLGQPGGGGAFAATTITAGSIPTGLALRDLDIDGRTDVLTTGLASADFRVLTSASNGLLNSAQTFAGTYEATSADFGDFDGDDRPDLVVTSASTRRVSVYRNISVDR